MLSLILAISISLSVGILAYIVDLNMAIMVLSHQMSKYELFHNLKIYLKFYAYIGMFLWIISLLLDRFIVKKYNNLDKKRFYFISAFYISAIIILGSWINYLFLPSFLSFKSIVCNVAFVFLISLISLQIYRYLNKNKIGFQKYFFVFTMLAILISLPLALGTANNIKKKYQLYHSIKNLKRDIRKSKDLNVIMILVDALRPDHLSCYGYHRNTSPAIDKLASQGAMFTRAYAQSSHTPESVPSIFTSLYPSALGTTNFGSIMPKAYPTIFEILKIHGLTTAILSEHGLLSMRYGWNTERGVDINICSALSERANTILSYIFITMEKVINKATKRGFLEKSKNIDIVGVFIQFLEQKKIDSPFIAYFHLAGPHAPYAPPQQYSNIFQDATNEEKIEVKNLRIPSPIIEDYPVSNAQLKNIIARYDEEILYTDQEQINRIIGALGKKDLLEKTMIIITADHGEEFYEHKKWQHTNNLFQYAIRVPLIIKLPERSVNPVQSLHPRAEVPGRSGLNGVKRKSIVETVRLIDIAPTILDYYGIEKPYFMEGKSLMPALKGEKWHSDYAYSEIHFLNPKDEFLYNAESFSLSLLKDNRHLVYEKLNNKERLLLFDIGEDPGEIKDISGENGEETKKMYFQLQEIRNNSKIKLKGSEKMRVIDKELKEHLRSLGYTM